MVFHVLGMAAVASILVCYSAHLHSAKFEPN